MASKMDPKIDTQNGPQNNKKRIKKGAQNVSKMNQKKVQNDFSLKSAAKIVTTHVLKDDALVDALTAPISHLKCLGSK